MVRLSPIDQCQGIFGRHGVDFPALLELHYRHGYVISTPEVFVMGRAVNRRWTTQLIRDPSVGWDVAYRPTLKPDAWWLHGFWGDASKLWPMMPYTLPYVGFEKFDEIPRFYPLETLRRFTHDLAIPASAA